MTRAYDSCSHALMSDEGNAAGSLSWGGTMLSKLARSDMCRLGLLALFRDINNGELPSEAHELLLAVGRWRCS